MAKAKEPAVFSIPVIRPFADALVEGIMAEQRGDRLALARGIILAPNSRGGLAIRDAFVRKAEDGLLLPRIVPIGDPDLGERAGSALDGIDDDPLPPAVDPLTRQLVLARLLQDQDGHDGANAMRLAADLARVLDQLTIEEKTPDDLRRLDPGGELSGHWLEALERMKTVLDLWPRELERLGRIDLTERRNRLLDRLAERWTATPPAGFVVAAGISTTAPAVARLLRAVARMPGGKVVLAGLDPLLPEEDWQALSADETTIESHPQFHLRQLLDRMGVARGEVKNWPGAGGRAGRATTLSNAFALPERTKSWADEKTGRTLHNVWAMELATPAEEAQAIALAVRESLETSARTVALVTPDRDLAGRVSAHLSRWGIAADDSAGRSLAATPPGSLLLALAQAAAESFAPSALMALLKHPLVMAGDSRLAWIDGARTLDLALRGPRPAPGLNGVSHALEQDDQRTAALRAAALDWWRGAHALLEPLNVLSSSLAASLAILREVATALGGDALWSGQDGRALANLVGDVEANAALGPAAVDPGSLPQLLRQLMDGIAIRPGYGGHPRVFIWGLIEARLQTADLIILSGLNEGVWPPLPAPDPWLAPPVRRALGLPGLERRIGLAGHDLVSAMGAPEVILTRAIRDARSPTIPSRLWLRIQALTGGLDDPPTRHDLLVPTVDGLRGAKPKRAGRPRQHVPLADRPRKVSVTEVDRLIADPYAFYAGKLLGLKALEPLDAEPGPAWRGSLIHSVLEGWAKEDECASGTLVGRMEAALEAAAIHPLVRALWLPRLVEASRWIEEEVAANRAYGRKPLVAEKSGWTVYRDIEIHGRADRIDLFPDDTLAVVDYKTGDAPSNKQVHGGFALQLGLIGLIAEQGGFGEMSGSARAFEYWSLSRGKDRTFGKRSTPVNDKTGFEPETFVDEIAARFAKAAARFLTGQEPFVAKLAPQYAWGDYDHLMRLEEWEGRDA